MSNDSGERSDRSDLAWILVATALTIPSQEKACKIAALRDLPWSLMVGEPAHDAPARFGP
jgi:hypothetical protein